MIPSLTVSSENQIVGSQSELEDRKPIKMQLFLRIEIGLFARLCFRLLVNLFFTRGASHSAQIRKLQSEIKWKGPFINSNACILHGEIR